MYIIVRGSLNRPQTNGLQLIQEEAPCSLARNRSVLVAVAVRNGNLDFTRC
jgi:hypothetical protein